MSALEREIIDKFRQLSPESRARVLSSLQDEAQIERMTLTKWLAETEAVRISLRPDASGFVPSASDLLTEIREERDGNILHSLGFRDSANNSPD